MKCALMLILAIAVAAPTLAPCAERAATAATAVAVEQLVRKECAACHGDDGNSVKAAVPKLAGQHADYLYKQLRNFKATGGKAAEGGKPVHSAPSDLVYVAAPEGKLPERMNPVYFLAMNGMVMGLSDAEMKAVSVYFSERRRTQDVPARNAEAFEQARRLYRAGDASRGLPSCAGCHGPVGAGLPAQFPRLSGQWPSYTAAQLKSFRAGERTNDPNRMMRDVAYKLTEDEIASLSEYIADLR
jgi:cytochrome c553